MTAELSLEQLGTKIDLIAKVAANLETQFIATHDEKEDEKKAKKAQEKEDKEHQEAKKAKRASKYAALKKAMEEPEDEKKDAAIKKAMEDYDEDHKGMDEKEHKKEAMTDEEKEEKASIAGIIGEKKQEIITKIMTANKIINPTQLKEIEARLKTASTTELKKEWSIIEPFVAGMNPTTTTTPQSSEQVIPYFANLDVGHIDNNQLNASSPDSAFAKFTTQELQEMNQ